MGRVPPPAFAATTTIGFVPIEGFRLLWRMQGPRRIVAAALQSHLAGTELIVFVEPHEAGDVLETRVSRFDVGELETRAEVLRRVLEEIRGDGYRPNCHTTPRLRRRCGCIPRSLGTVASSVFVVCFGRDRNVGFQSPETRN